MLEIRAVIFIIILRRFIWRGLIAQEHFNGILLDRPTSEKADLVHTRQLRFALLLRFILLLDSLKMLVQLHFAIEGLNINFNLPMLPSRGVKHFLHGSFVCANDRRRGIPLGPGMSHVLQLVL